jgi:predicted LPLAT superfamily acyltransferase
VNTRWSSRSAGSRLQHRIFYALIRLAGTTGAYVLLAFVISWYMLRPSMRKRGGAYLRRRFPQAGFAGILPRTWKLQWTFGQCLTDRAAAGILGGFSLEERFGEKLGALAREGRGVILLAAHTGCWQMAPYALAEHAGMPVTVLTRKEHGDIDRQAHEHAGTAPPFRTVNAGGGPEASIALAGLLRHGELLCMMGDRIVDDAEPAVRVSFFGAFMMLPSAAYRLASASGAPVVCAFPLRTGPRKGALRIADIIRIPERLGKNPESCAPYAQIFAVALERFCRENPYQFFNFYDLWER